MQLKQYKNNIMMESEDELESQCSFWCSFIISESDNTSLAKYAHIRKNIYFS